MKARNLTLTMSYILAGTGAAAVFMAPVPRLYPITIAAFGIIGITMDYKDKHFIPRMFLNILGLAGFFYTLFPFSRETLAEQSLSALSLLMAVKLLGPKERRDHLQILALSLIIVSGGASLAPELVYGLLFVTDLAIGILILIWLPFSSELKTEKVERGLLRRLGVISWLLSLAAIPLAMIIFTILPRAYNPFWMGFAPRMKPVSGFSDKLRLGQVGKISLSQEVAFRAEMINPKGPLPGTPYWRGIVMEITDGRQWSAPTLREPVRGTGQRYTVRITYYLEPHGEREIFLLEQPVAARAGFRALSLGRGGIARLRGSLYKPFRYQGSSNPSDVRSATITTTERNRNLRLPPGFSPRIRALAATIAGGWDDPEDAAERMVDFLKEGFNYSLDVPRSTGEPLEGFLFDHRTGYCEYFASSLAVMLRAVGVPARLVAGYLGGEYNLTGNYYIVRQAAAHTWVEAYFEGKGWVRLDPTPAAGELGTTLASRRSSKPALWLDALRMKWNSWVVQYDTEVQVDFIRDTGRSLKRLTRLRLSMKSVGKIILTAVFSVLLWMTIRWFITRSRDPIMRRYGKFGRLMAKKGFERFRCEGPLDHARRIGASCSGSKEDVLEFMNIYARWRYRGDFFHKRDINKLDALLKNISSLQVTDK